MPVYTIGKTNIEYKLVRREKISRRYIRITPAYVLVTVHAEDTPRDIADFLKRKERWLFDNTQHVRKAVERRSSIHEFVSGAKIPFRGRLFVVVPSSFSQAGNLPKSQGR